MRVSERLTILTTKGPALKLDNPGDEEEARRQLHDKYLEAIGKLYYLEVLQEAGMLAVIPESGIGDLSDGYHTFNELYHHRAILFSAICNAHPESAWKAKKHSDGTMYDGMFIVGINTPTGQATYHYDINPYWDIFKVTELESAPEWDGHTPEEAISRIEMLALEEAERKKEKK